MKIVSKVLAAVLCFVMLVGTFSTTAFAAWDNVTFEGTTLGTDDYYNVISKNDYVLVPNAATETEMVINNSEGTRRQVLHILEVDPSNPDISIVPGYYNIDKDTTDIANQKASKLTDMAAYYEDELGYNIVGGMNTDLYYAANEPRVLIYNGQDLRSGRTTSSVLCVYKDEDGTVSCEVKAYNASQIDEDLASGRLLHAVGVSFGMVVKDGELVSKSVNRNDAAARSMVGIKEDGTLVICMNDGRGANNSVGLSSYEEGEIMLSLGCKWAANCDGGGSSTFLTKRAGEDEFTMRSVPCDGAERPTIHGIFVTSNVAPTGVLNNINITSDYDYFAPGTTYTFSASAIDTHGYAMDIPNNVTWALSDESFGTVENGTFVSNGTLGDVAVQVISDGTIVGSKTIHIVNPTTLKLSATSTVLPYSTSDKVREITLPIVAMVGEENVYYDTSTFDISLSDDKACTIDGFKLTATSDTSVSGVVVTAKYLPTSTDLVYTIEFGKGSEVLYNFEDGDINDWLGYDEANQWLLNNGVESPLNGLFTAGQISVSCDSTTFLATKENGGQVKNGKNSLGVEFDFRYVEYASWVYAIFYNVGGQTVLRDVANGQKATSFGMWVYVPEGFYDEGAGSALAMQLTAYTGSSSSSYKGTQIHFTYNGKNFNALTEADIPESRWIYVSADLSKYNYVSLQDPTSDYYRSPAFIRMYVKPTVASELTYYFDDFTLDYSTAVDDREAPVISDACYSVADTNIAIEGQTIDSNVVSFTASIADYVKSNSEGLDYSTAAIYVDGIEVSGVKASGSVLSVEDVVLSNGTHNIKFEIADKLGNYAELTKTLTVNSATAPSAVNITGHNDLNNTPEYDSVYYVDLKADDITAIDSITTTLNLQTANTWELEHMIVSDGFKASYEYNEISKLATITVTKEGTCNLTGEQILVSIPVRVWSWDESKVVDRNGSTMTKENKFASTYCPIVSIDVNIESGTILYTNATNGTFSGSISVDTMVNDIVNPWHNHDDELTIQNKNATCTTDGFSGRTYCESCGSVIDWGETVPATNHNFELVDNVLKCTNDTCEITFTGTWTDGKDYVDGIAVADGWNGDYYYENGVKYTGVKAVDGVYYNFGEDGVSQGKYNGLLDIDGKNYYIIAGNFVSGWQLIDNQYYYFDKVTYAGLNGTYHSSEVCSTSKSFEYSFTNGKLDSGVWVETSEGTRYYYGNSHYAQTMQTIDGKVYGFNSNGYRYEGPCVIRWNPRSDYQLFEFTEDGEYIGELYENGIFETSDGSIYYLTDGIANTIGLVQGDDGNYYYINQNTMTAIKDRTYYVSITNDLLPVGNYAFGADGKMKQGITTDSDGEIRYYVNGKATYAGLVQDADGNYYYISGSTMAAIKDRSYNVSKTNDLLPLGNYAFGADGKMKQGLVTDSDGEIRYYENGKATYAGLVQGADGNYYYISGSTMAAIKDRSYNVSKTNGLLPVGVYTFGADGKMKFGLVTDSDGEIRYYDINGKATYAGLVQDANGNYYYISGSTMTAIKGRSYNVSKTNGLLPVGVYTFDADGKMILE